MTTAPPRIVDIMDGAGATCPVCNMHTSRVIETRCDKGAVFRRRRCRCGETFTTAEQTIDNTMRRIIVKGEGFKALSNDRET